jgi:hypothetical protein
VVRTSRRNLAGAGLETLWNFSHPNGAFAFIPFLLMGGTDVELDTCGQESLKSCG